MPTGSDVADRTIRPRLTRCVHGSVERLAYSRTSRDVLQSIQKEKQSVGKRRYTKKFKEASKKKKR